MAKKNLIWWIIEAIIWYVWLYYFLFSIKNPVDIAASALILLVLAYLGTLACPWFRNTEAWRKLKS